MRSYLLSWRLGIFHPRCLEGRRVAQGTSDFRKQPLPVLGAVREWSGARCIDEAHELGEHDPRREDFQRILKRRINTWLIKRGVCGHAVVILAPRDRKE